MRLDDERESRYVDDRRGQSGGSQSFAAQGLMFLFSRFGFKGGLVAIAAVMLAGFFGIDLKPLLGLSAGGQTANSSRLASSEEQELNTFSRKVLSTTERVWAAYFQQQGWRAYRPTTLVLYRGGTQSACGYGQATMGPFYCSADEKVYLDLSFYDDMRKKLKAGGDFAFAYVIAHEVGHHVQHLTGILGQVHEAQRKLPKKEANQMMVRLELQADCYAGVWAHYMMRENRLETGDMEEAFAAAEAVGDDRLQKQHQGYVVPDSFTHGTSKQRLTWFQRGMQTGDPKQCDTFGAKI